MSTQLEDATELLAHLGQVEDLRAYTDPAEAASNRPCILLGPPATDYTRRVRTWTLKALADDLGGGLATWEQLETLEAQVVSVLPVESSRPAAANLSEDLPRVPCHELTVRTTT